jgi:hypothetical protein
MFLDFPLDLAQISSPSPLTIGLGNAIFSVSGQAEH